MRFYTRQHRHYCGIDLHVKTMYVCVLDATGQVVLHRNLKSTPEAFLQAVAPYRDDLVVAAECMFTWYWLADLCAAEDIPFVLGHALAMRAIHGGKAKNDKIDSQKIAALLRGGLFSCGGWNGEAASDGGLIGQAGARRVAAVVVCRSQRILDPERSAAFVEAHR